MTTLSARVAQPVPSGTTGLFDEAHERFRADARHVLEGLGDDVRRTVSREAFGVIGASGLLRRRWEPGETDGVGFGLILAEEAARVSSGLGLAVMTHTEVFTNALVRLAETERQSALLDSALAGEVVGCFAVTEPHGGSDIARVRSTARQSGRGWHLTGAKRFVSNVGKSTHGLVLARIDGRPAGHDSGLFVVPLDAAGVTITRFHQKPGLLACDLGDLLLDVMLEGDALLGAPGAGVLYTNRLLQLERLSIACQLLAAAWSSFGIAVAYARRRHLATGTVISKQAVRHQLADCQTALWSATAFFGSVVTRLRDGQSVAHETAALKLHVAGVASSVIDDSVQLLGARGYTGDFPLEQWLRDARVARLGGGPDEVLRDVVASKLDRPNPYFDGWVDRVADDL